MPALKLLGVILQMSCQEERWHASFVEEFLNRRLFMSFCCIQINELPFRHIMEKLDGPTSSGKGWYGPVGKLVSKVETMEREIANSSSRTSHLYPRRRCKRNECRRYLSIEAIIKKKLDPISGS